MAPALGNNEHPKEELTTVYPQSPDDISLTIVTANNKDIPNHPEFSPKKKLLDKFRNINTIQRIIKFIFCILFIGILLLARFGIPDNEVQCVQDKLIDLFQFANKFINTPGNEFYRDFFQSLCSLFVDVAFFTTFGYWVLHGTSIRLPICMGVFYGVRALVQAVWFSPFPEGFYWMSPGFPSLVVPYGRGSDFFFSGHAGFMVICAMEWHVLGARKMRNAMIAATLYTFLILLVYRIHYSIDIFTGAIFAEWTFGKVDILCRRIDRVWMNILDKIMMIIGHKECHDDLQKNSVCLDRQIK